jgi:glutamyl/glutaminyl-tRNA synthetase
MYDWARQLVKAGKAYVDDQSPDEIRRPEVDGNREARMGRQRVHGTVWSQGQNLDRLVDVRFERRQAKVCVLRAGKDEQGRGQVTVRDKARLEALAGD